MIDGTYWTLLKFAGSRWARRDRIRRWRRREEAGVARLLAAASTPQDMAEVRARAQALAIFFDGPARAAGGAQ